MHIEENEARTKVIVAPVIGKRTGSLFNQGSCSPRDVQTGARCTSWQKAIRIMRREDRGFHPRIGVARDRENILYPFADILLDIRNSLLEGE